MTAYNKAVEIINRKVSMKKWVGDWHNAIGLISMNDTTVEKGQKFLSFELNVDALKTTGEKQLVAKHFKGWVNENFLSFTEYLAAQHFDKEIDEAVKAARLEAERILGFWNDPNKKDTPTTDTEKETTP